MAQSLVWECRNPDKAFKGAMRYGNQASMAALSTATPIPRLQNTAAEAAAEQSLNSTAEASDDEHAALVTFLRRRVQAHSDRLQVLAERAQADMLATGSVSNTFSGNFLRANAALQSTFGTLPFNR